MVDFLRCIKFWHSRRQIPGTKEGGYPILAWILFAVQRLQDFVSQEATCLNNLNHLQRLLAALDYFFQSLDCHAAAERSSHSRLWPFPCILDPVATNAGNAALTHDIPVATQLLYADEFLRARALVRAAVSGDGTIERLFENESSTLLPADGACGAFIFKRQKIWLVEVKSVKLRDNWTAPFLHRCDSQTELQGCLLSVDGTGAVQRFPELRQRLTFTPSDFVVCAQLECIAEGAAGNPGKASSVPSSMRLPHCDLRRWQDLHKLLLLIP